MTELRDHDERFAALRAIVEAREGDLLPDALAAIAAEDWQDYYPLVDADGRLTGDIADADDSDMLMVDWNALAGRLEAGEGCSDAMISKWDWREMRKKQEAQG